MKSAYLTHSSQLLSAAILPSVGCVEHLESPRPSEAALASDGTEAGRAPFGDVARVRWEDTEMVEALDTQEGGGLGGVSVCVRPLFLW